MPVTLSPSQGEETRENPCSRPRVGSRRGAFRRPGGRRGNCPMSRFPSSDSQAPGSSLPYRSESPGGTRHPTGVLWLQWGMRAPRHLRTSGAALLPQGSRVQLPLRLRVTRSTLQDLAVEHVYVTGGFFQVLPHRAAEKKKIKATPPGKQERDPRASR